MATLTDITGDWISLEILGYEFPSPWLESDNDANWLMFRFSAQLRGQNWSSEAPAITTWGVPSLIAFLESIAEDNIARGEYLLNEEPEFWLKVLDSELDPRRISIHLSHSFCPPNKAATGRGYYVLRVTARSLRAFVAELRGESSEYPVRVAGDMPAD